MTKSQSMQTFQPTLEDIECFLKEIGTTPAAFGELCARATYLDKSDALIEIEQALGRLRAQRAQRLNDPSLKGKPSEVELYFGLNRGKIRATITRQSNRSRDIAMQRLNDPSLPVSQRFLALQYLLDIRLDEGLIGEEGDPREMFIRPKTQRLAEFLKSSSFN